MAEVMRDFHRRGGTVRRLMACTLLSAPVALAATLVLSCSGHAEAARGAAPKLEQLPGRQGAVPPGASFLGPAPASTELPLVVTLQPRDPQGLAAEAQAVSDPSSPEYHHFLSPRQFAQRYGATSATIRQVTQDLDAQGLTVGPASTTGLSLPVSGTAAHVQSAFSTTIDRYRLASGKTGLQNRSAPEVPATIAPAIEGVIGLDTLSPPQPTMSPPDAAPTGAAGGAAASTASPAQAPGQPSPVAGTCTSDIDSVQTTYGALDADDLAQAYSFDPLYATGDYGSGTTVALVELAGAGYNLSDITDFANCYGITLGNGQVSQVAIDGGGATGPNTVEAELDIETVLSLAPQANIEVYEGGISDGIYNVLSRIVSDDSAKIVSASWTNGCESYVGQSLQNSENTLLQAAAVDGQSVFVSTGDQGSEGCNVNGVVSAPTGSDPVAQVVDATTGTVYVANKSSNTVSVDSEGTASDPSDFASSGSVTTGSKPDAISLDSSLGKVFVANATSSSLTTFATSTCNQTATSGCASPTQITSGGDLSNPRTLAANGSTLYVGNSNGTVAVYNATTNAYVDTVTLPSSSVPSALAVDPTNGFVYVADGTNDRVEYFDISTCNASTTTGCSTTPATVAVGNDPISLAVDAAVGSLFVANAGTGGGISVLNLTSHDVTATISTGPSVSGLDGTAVVRSVALSPDGTEILAALEGLEFPGDVLATIDPNTQSITATANLETGSDTLGELSSDSSRNYVWVTDGSAGDDVVQNLNLAVSDPASQPYVTAVGGTSLTLSPARTETTWNDQLHFAEGAGGGGVSETFSMPAYQQPLGTVTGSTGTPCGNSSGDCREIPDVSADADPSTGYVIYDSVNSLGWTAVGGTSGAAPLWAGVLAVVASADGTAGDGALNPVLYQLAQESPGTYLNDVTTGNNDYNATNAGQYGAMSGYDMATGLGTPVTSALATALAPIPLDVAVSGSQAYGGSPGFTGTAPDPPLPAGVGGVDTSGLTCSEVAPATAISPSLAGGTYTLVPGSCSGVTLSGSDPGGYTVVFTSASGDFSVTGGPPPPPPPPTPHGYWLVGSDGGIFTFGSAGFHGSTGSLKLQRPVVGITPTADEGGYWLVASDGGIFAFGDAGFHGSIPGLGLAPAGSGLSHALNAPIVGMVPSADGGGYFMVASDGGVFAFGDARFEGSCPGIGGCSGAAVAVVPDATGQGYWLVTQAGDVYTFGDAPYFGAPGPQGSPITAAVRSADGHGYYVLLANGTVYGYGDAVSHGGPSGSVGGFDPASAIFTDTGGGGYWVASAAGDVFTYGDAPNDGSMAGSHLNGAIIAGTGF